MHDKITELQPENPDRDKKNNKKKRSSAGPVLLFLLVAVLAGGFFLWRSTRKPPTTAAAGRGGRGNAAGDGNANVRVPVVVAAVQRRDLPVYLDGLGSVDAFNTVTVKSRVDGELMEVDFKEGQEVRKGDQLAVIDSRPYQVALSSAQANLAKDQAQLNDAKLNVERYAQLVKEGIIPQQQYDTQNSLATQLGGSVQADQAQIDNAKLNITYSHITSPIDGRVGLRLVDAGNIVHASDPNGLLVITQMQPIVVIFTLPEDNLPAVNTRMRSGATLVVNALSRDNGVEVASGTLLTIDNQIDQTTGTFRLKAVFDNKDRNLWPNQFVNARLLIDVKKNATLIPAAAIQHGDQGTFVYRVNPTDNTAEVRPVTVGMTQDTTSVIDGGLSPNDLVVTDGQDRLRAGVRVDPRPDSRPTGPANASAGAQSGNPKSQGTPGAPGANQPRSGPPAGAQSLRSFDPQKNQQNGQQGNKGRRQKQQ
jgi:multidrug efflux system membrane fusion protein